MKFSGRITPSVIMSFYVFTICAVLSIILKDSNIILSGMGVCVILIGGRTVKNGVVDLKHGRFESK